MSHRPIGMAKQTLASPAAERRIHHARAARVSTRAMIWRPIAGMMLGAAVAALTVLLDTVEVLHLPQRWSMSTSSTVSFGEMVTGFSAGVIGVVLSMMLVALTLASQQFGPRMLRLFMRDRGTQIAIGALIGVASNAAVVTWLAGMVRRDGANPAWPMTGAMLVASSGFGLVVLVLFVHHLAARIQIANVIGRLATDFELAIDDLIASGHRDDGHAHAIWDGATTPLIALHSGYIRSLDREKMISLAARSDAVARVDRRVGEFVVEGDSIGLVVIAGSVSGSVPDDHASAVAVGDAEGELARALARCVDIGRTRTELQDVAYPLDQLVEIALRAMSPAVNDPYTARSCIDWLSSGLAYAMRCGTYENELCDAAGAIRLVIPQIDAAWLIDRAFHPLRGVISASVSVTLRALDSLALLAELSDAATQDAIAGQIDRLVEAFESQAVVAADTDEVRRRAETCRLALDLNDR